MMTATHAVPAATVWLNRLRFVVATAIVWALLQFAVAAYILPAGVNRPPVLINSPYGPLAGLLVVVALWIGAALATLIVGAGDPRRPLMVLGLALALWAYAGGTTEQTMDSWLMLNHDTAGPPTGGPYWLLLGDYACLILAVGGAYLLVMLLGARQRRSAAQDPSTTSGPHGGLRQGLSASLLTLAIAGVAMYILTGSPAAWTFRGQVYFAVGLGFIIGTYAAQRFLGVHDPLWYWPIPLVLGIVGVVVAGIAPDLRLPPEYHDINTIPAWGLARALPVEMVGVGLVATLWMLPRPARRDEE